MSAYIFCHCNATLHPPSPPAFRSPAGSSVCCSCFVALFFRICCHFSLSHSNTGLVWPNPDPAAGFCPVPVESSPLCPLSFPLCCIQFNISCYISLHAQIYYCENGKLACCRWFSFGCRFPLSLSLLLFLFIPCSGSSSHWATHFAHFVLDGLSWTLGDLCSCSCLIFSKSFA